jgi:hypothetical protein
LSLRQSAPVDEPDDHLSSMSGGQRDAQSQIWPDLRQLRGAADRRPGQGHGPKFGRRRDGIPQRWGVQAERVC